MGDRSSSRNVALLDSFIGQVCCPDLCKYGCYGRVTSGMDELQAGTCLFENEQSCVDVKFYLCPFMLTRFVKFHEKAVFIVY